MLSRVAEHLYWLARYLERAENAARLVNTNAFLLLDLPRGIAPGWDHLVAITGAQQFYAEHHEGYDERSVAKFLISDMANPGSILGSLVAARENCRAVRDIVPRATWEQITELVIYARENAQSGIGKRGRHAYLKQIIEGSQKVTGMLESTMIRDAGYQFLRIGRNLERADMTTRIIDVRTENILPDDKSELRPFETIQWMSVLKSLTAYHMYRRKMQVQIKRNEVLTFLFLDQQFPRSILHCLLAVEESVGSLKLDRTSIKAIRALVQKLDHARLDNLPPKSLHIFIDKLQLGFTQLHACIADAYFLPTQEVPQSQTQRQSA